MPITIKEIAKLAGVSTGTVDRVIHNRGRVKPEVALRVKEIAKEFGYEPSRVGRALVLKRNPISIGVVLHDGHNAFMRYVLNGIENAKSELESMGANIMVRAIRETDSGAQINTLNELLSEGAQAIAVSPVDHTSVGYKIKEIAESGIPIVTFNTDIAYTGRMCFVGLDNLRSGRVAADLMGVMLGGRGKVAVISGHLTNQSHNLRVEGFLKELHNNRKDVLVTGVHVCYENAEEAERQALNCIEATPDLAGILIAAGGETGVYEALRKTGKSNEIKVVAYDMIPETIEALKEGVVDFVIDQNAYAQGYQPAHILFEYLLSGKKPAGELLHTDIIIKTRLNI